jgi:hypothetical protein
MDETLAIKWHLEGILLSRIEKAMQSVKEIPEVMHRVVVIQTTEDFCRETKKDYAIIKKQFAKENFTIDFTVPEFNQIIDDVASEILYLLSE